LNTRFSKDRCCGCLGIESSKVKLLKKIVDNTSAKIVLTSTWKLDWEKSDNLSPSGQYLVNKFKEEGLEIFDKTEEVCMDFRGAGILDWIHSHNVEAFVILDDESFDFNDLGLSEHFVKTSFYKEDGGLQEEHVKSAIKILNEVM
jgi:hypothetical protein